MNPELIAEVTKKTEIQLDVNRMQESGMKAGKTVFIVILIAVALVAIWWFARKQIKQAKENRFNNTDTTAPIGSNAYKNSLAVNYAQRIKASRGAWGGLLNDNEDAIFQVAKDMRANNVPFSTVAKAYNDGFGSMLAQDLTSWLSPEELQKFYTLLGSTPINGLRGYKC
jgi:hypothetical protein